MSALVNHWETLSFLRKEFLRFYSAWGEMFVEKDTCEDVVVVADNSMSLYQLNCHPIPKRAPPFRHLDNLCWV